LYVPRLDRHHAGGFSFVAETNPDAPKTVAAFLKLLPYRQKIIHVRWSGEGCWIPLGEFELGVGFENHTSHPSVGDVLFYPGGYSETEIILAYSSCSFASKMGPLAGNHFLTIVGRRVSTPGTPGVITTGSYFGMYFADEAGTATGILEGLPPVVLTLE